MIVVQVIPIQRGIKVELLSYYSKDAIKIGSLVTVPMRKREILALVVDTIPLENAKADLKNARFSLKKVTEVKSVGFLPAYFLKAIKETSEYFILSQGSLLFSLLPITFLKQISTTLKTQNKVSRTQNIKKETFIYQAPEEDRLSFYKTYVRESIAKKESIFICLPSIQFIEYYEKELSKGVEQYSVSLHSGLTPKEFKIRLDLVINSEKPVVILATPSFLWIPRDDLETIIVEQESSPSYQTIGRNSFDIKVFIEALSYFRYTKLIWSNTILRSQLIKQYQDGEVMEVTPPNFRLHVGEIEIIDRSKKEGEKFEIINKKILNEITELHEAGKKSFIFSLRKGMSTKTICHDCSHILTEKGAPLVLYEDARTHERYFKTPFSKERITANQSCKNCGSWDLRTFGVGTHTIEDSIKEHDEKIPVFRIDKEVTPTQKSIRKVLDDFSESQGGVLVGTELVMHHMKDVVDKVFISSFDTLFSIPAYNIYHRVIQLFLTLDSYSRNGMVIQTHQPKHQLLRSLAGKNLTVFFKEDLKLRELLRYPPFYRIIKINETVPHKDIDLIKEKFERELYSFKPAVTTKKVDITKTQVSCIIRVPANMWDSRSYKTGLKRDQTIEKILKSLPQFTSSIQIDPDIIV